MSTSRKSIINSLRKFKSRRDDLLHEDRSTFDHNLARFVLLCTSDSFIQSVIQEAISGVQIDEDMWWQQVNKREITFPMGDAEDFALRHAIIQTLKARPREVFDIGFALGKTKGDEITEVVRSVLIRPYLEELTYRLSEAAEIATPEARAVQAVSLDRIVQPDQARIFLSHKSVDKPIVRRYYNSLKELGFSPWLDESDMPAGTKLHRGILDGFKNSCAAIFFITENFVDERFLATEVDYAIDQKYAKDKKFTIVTLRYPDSQPVPELLRPYVYKDVENDLDGLYQVLRALPIEVGAVRWKKDVI